MSKSFDEKRTADNKELVELLAMLVAENPSERFHQILRNYGFINEDRSTGSPRWENEFYLEPGVAVARVKAKIKEMDELRKSQKS